MEAPIDRERRSTLAELGRDVVLEDEEGTLYFQCNDAGTGKAVSLSISHTTVNLEMYKEGQGMHSERFPFEQLKSWEVRRKHKTTRAKKSVGGGEGGVGGSGDPDGGGGGDDEDKQLYLDFGSNRDPPTITLRTPDAEKVAGVIRGKIEGLIAQRREQGETIAPIADKSTQYTEGGMGSLSEEFRKEFAATYKEIMGGKWLKLVSSITTTVISVIIMFGFMVATFVVVGITWNDYCEKPLQPWALVTGIISFVHIFLDCIRIPVVVFHTLKDDCYRIQEFSVKNILLNPLLWLTLVYVVLSCFWLAWFIVGLVWVDNYSCSSTISNMVKALTFCFWNPVVAMYVVGFSIFALWRGPLYV